MTSIWRSRYLRISSPQRLVLLLVLVVSFLHESVQGFGETTGRIALSIYSTCVVWEDLTSECFGTNYRDAVDPNSLVTELDPFVPPGPILNIGTGGNWFRCALYASRTVRCRGNDGNKVIEELGDRMIEHNHDIIQLATGTVSACMLNSTGSIHCWGGKFAWQDVWGLWQPHEHVDYPTTGGYRKNKGFTAVSVGKWHTCALHGDGSAILWGYTVQLTAPAMTWDDSEKLNVKSIFCGNEITCFVYVNGSAVCKVSSENALRLGALRRRDSPFQRKTIHRAMTGCELSK